MSTNTAPETSTTATEPDPVVIEDHDATTVDQEMARTTAVGLGIWLLLTFLAVGFLVVFGDPISSAFV